MKYKELILQILCCFNIFFKNKKYLSKILVKLHYFHCRKSKLNHFPIIKKLLHLIFFKKLIINVFVKFTIKFLIYLL